MQQGADPLLARRDDPAPQRVRAPAERGQQLLRHVSSLVPDLPEALRPGQHADHRHCQREHQAEPPATHLARIPDPGQDARQAGNLLISAGQGSYTGMRNWHRWPLVPELIWRDTLIISDRATPANQAIRARRRRALTRRSQPLPTGHPAINGNTRTQTTTLPIPWLLTESNSSPPPSPTRTRRHRRRAALPRQRRHAYHLQLAQPGRRP